MLRLFQVVDSEAESESEASSGSKASSGSESESEAEADSDPGLAQLPKAPVWWDVCQTVKSEFNK